MTWTSRQERTIASNKRFAIAGGVHASPTLYVQGGSSVLRMEFSAKNPRFRKPRTRLWR